MAGDPGRTWKPGPNKAPLRGPGRPPGRVSQSPPSLPSPVRPFASYTACQDATRPPFLQPGQNPGRRRFSIAHELGHYHFPTHTNGPRECGASALQASHDFGQRAEWEANSFAAELLMPTRLFRRDARRREVSFKAAYELMSQDIYGVSATACCASGWCRSPTNPARSW